MLTTNLCICVNDMFLMQSIVYVVLVFLLIFGYICVPLACSPKLSKCHSVEIFSVVLVHYVDVVVYHEK